MLREQRIRYSDVNDSNSLPIDYEIPLRRNTQDNRRRRNVSNERLLGPASCPITPKQAYDAQFWRMRAMQLVTRR